MFHIQPTRKCPKCEAVLTEAVMEHFPISDGTLRLATFSASCPRCHAILGVVTDPRPQDGAMAKIMKALNIR